MKHWLVFFYWFLPISILAQGVAPAQNEGAIDNGQPLAQQTELIMFEEDGCQYCYRFHKELDRAYENSTEGKLAPLRVVDMHKPIPAGVTMVNGPIEYSPTFVLIYDGKEVGRMVGYRGDQFFWVELQELFVKLPAELGYTPSI